MNSDIDLLNYYFPELPPVQAKQFEKLFPLYQEWNDKINVISRKDIDHLYERHVLHSLGIAKVYQFPAGSKVVDAGTGGGFPGIPLAILFPDVKFHLVDSIGKKVKVVGEIISALQLKNVTAEQNRVEDVKQKFDFAVSRAVAPLKDLVQLIMPVMQHEYQLFFLKGGDLSDEIIAYGKAVSVFSFKNFFEESFFETKSVLSVKSS